jgi:hypothetical protein
MRRAARTDTNHRELFDLAENMGGFVLETHQLGNDGAPDGFVWSVHTGWLAVEKSATVSCSRHRSACRRAPRWRCGGHGRMCVRRLGWPVTAAGSEPFALDECPTVTSE